MNKQKKTWCNNGKTNKLIVVGESLPEGFVLGRKQNRKKSNKGRHPYTDGERLVYLYDNDEIPEGFHRGITDGMRKHLRNICDTPRCERSDEHKRKISDSAKKRFSNKENHPMFGKKQRESTKVKISEKNKGRVSCNKGKRLTDDQKKNRIIKIENKYGSLEEFYKLSNEKASKTKEIKYGDPNYNNRKKCKETIDRDDSFYDRRWEKAKNTIENRYGSVNNLSKIRLENIAKSKGFDSVEDYIVFWENSKSRGNQKLTKLEKRFEEFLKNNDFNYDKYYRVVKDNISHEFDFAIFDENDNLVYLVDCDGLYFHGYLSDITGKKVNNYSDDYRSMLVPKGVKFKVILEGKENEREAFRDFLRIVNINYDNYIEDIFTWCRDIGFPYPNYSDKILKKSYESLIKSEEGVLNPLARFGEKVLLNFHHSAFEAHKKNKPSPLDAWNDDTMLKNCIENRIIYKGNNIDPSRVLGGLSASGVAPRVSIFNPYVARYIINKYLRDFDTIFDPCSGYSGRMLGACSLGKRYVGFDINRSTVDESREIINYLKLDASVECDDSLQRSGSFDCLFTCTPYSNKECWGEDKYNYSCDEWIDRITNNYLCKRYVFVVDSTEKYKENVVWEIENKSHFGKNKELIIVIDKDTQISFDDEEEVQG